MQERFNLTEAAKEIGICRAWLYRKYLNRYPPTEIAGQPTLTSGQIEKIKAERDAKRNGGNKGRKHGSKS